MPNYRVCGNRSVEYTVLIYADNTEEAEEIVQGARLSELPLVSREEDPGVIIEIIEEPEE
mgnify:CR=1 FL=1